MSPPAEPLLVQQRITNRLLVRLLTAGIPEVAELVELLVPTGAADEDLAALLGVTPGTVAVLRRSARKPTSTAPQ